MKQKTNFTISDDLALGVYDADGSVLFITQKRKLKNGRISLTFYVKYALEQSLSKKDLVEKFAAKFEGSINTTGKCVFRANPNKPAGKLFRQFLNKNKPLLPSRRRDYLISEQVLNLNACNMHKTKDGLITISRLVANRSISQVSGNVDSEF